MTWIPPRSPWGLIQEDLFPDRWLILVSCIMLNCTSRKQVQEVLGAFMIRYPGPQVFMDRFDVAEVGNMIATLGFRTRRTVQLKKMTEAYLSGGWEDARELPGIGEYGGRAYDIFCRGIMGENCPRDGALGVYWRWFRRHHEEVTQTNPTEDRSVA